MNDEAQAATRSFYDRNIVDCQPIDVVRLVTDAGFANVTESRIEIWTMPVAIVLCHKGIQ